VLNEETEGIDGGAQQGRWGRKVKKGIERKKEERQRKQAMYE
jgi:hypothetical protein